MAICIPDASVIVKWVLPADEEPYVDAAEAIRDPFVKRPFTTPPTMRSR